MISEMEVAMNRCEHEFKEGIALKNESVLFADFSDIELRHVNMHNFGLRGNTCSDVGEAKIVKVEKCVKCGFSRR